MKCMETVSSIDAGMSGSLRVARPQAGIGGRGGKIETRNTCTGHRDDPNRY